MSPRSRTAAGITTQLLYAALLGAAYAAIVSRKPSQPDVILRTDQRRLQPSTVNRQLSTI
jgi:hypothetical protein